MTITTSSDITSLTGSITIVICYNFVAISVHNHRSQSKNMQYELLSVFFRGIIYFKQNCRDNNLTFFTMNYKVNDSYHDLDYVDVQSDECEDELSDYVVEEPDWIPPPVCLPSSMSSSDDGSEEESVEEDVEDESVDEVIVFPAGENFFYSAELLAMADRQLAAMYNTEEGYDGDDEDEDEDEDVEEVEGVEDMEDVEGVASDDYVLFFNDGVDIVHKRTSVFDGGIPKHIGQ